MTVRTEVCVRRYAPRQVMPAHSHDDALMSIVLGGTFRETIGNSERFYTHGHVTFFPAGRMHAQDFGPSGARQIIFRPQPDWLGWLSECGTELDTAPYTKGAEFYSLGDRLLRELENDDPLAAVAREGILLEIIAAFGRRDANARKPSRIPGWLIHARDYLHENACRPLRLIEVARAAGRHETHLAREFRRCFGTSVTGYVRRLRIEQAARLLSDGDSEISAIAFDCGFSSHSHLTREFRLFYGTTPSTWRLLSRK